MSNNTQGGTSGFSVFLAWIVVSIPLAWGVYETLLNAMTLFK